MEQKKYEGVVFQYPYVEYTNFKQKEASSLIYMLSKQRLNDDMQFESYANMSFDENDMRHEFPVFTAHATYSRKNTNCLIYNISNSPRDNVHKYDKLFIYHYVGKVYSYYGFALLNTNTKEYSNRFVIDHEEGELFMALNRYFWSITRIPVLKKLSDKYDKIKITKVEV
jgi:hypothetical protein